MLRAGFIALLTYCICASAMARNGHAPSTTVGAGCHDMPDRTTETTLSNDMERTTQRSLHDKYSPARLPHNGGALPAAGSRGGGNDDNDSPPPLSRPRMPKWHSFLPGMFR